MRRFRCDWMPPTLCLLVLIGLAGCEPTPSSPARPTNAGRGDATPDKPGQRAFGDGASQVQPARITQSGDPQGQAHEDVADDNPEPEDDGANKTTATPPPADDHATAAEAAAEPAGDAADDTSVGKLDELFRGWRDPALVFVITGEIHGYIEPCGCAGKEHQKGGLSRRHTFFNHLRDKLGWQVAALDLGGQVRRFGPQTDIKFHSILEGLRILQYDAIALGPDDLRLPDGELLSEQGRFVSANVDILAPLPRTVIIQRGGRTIGVTAVFGDGYRKLVNNDAVQFHPIAKSLEPVVADLKDKQKCDFLVLLSHAPREESLALARQFPQFDIVVTAGGADEPPHQPARVDDSNQWMVEAGHKGMYASVIGLFDDSEEPMRYERVALDARYKDSPDMLQLLAIYQEQLKVFGLEGLDVRPQSHPSGHTFVGSQVCGSCHTEAMKVFDNTPHAHALTTLVNLNPPRHYDPECLSCHVTGWEPQRFTPFNGGYLDLERTPQLQHNGCENCHGPGSAHAAVEAGDQPAMAAERDALRLELRLTLDQAEQKCEECHDRDNSPHFNFNDPDEKNGPRYWPKVEHHGKE